MASRLPRALGEVPCTAGPKGAATLSCDNTSCASRAPQLPGRHPLRANNDSTKWLYASKGACATINSAHELDICTYQPYSTRKWSSLGALNVVGRQNLHEGTCFASQGCQYVSHSAGVASDNINLNTEKSIVEVRNVLQAVIPALHQPRIAVADVFSLSLSLSLSLAPHFHSHSLSCVYVCVVSSTAGGLGYLGC
jgi:hypothetical protein